MWKPLEPDVLTQLGRPSSASRSRSASAPRAARRARRRDGSRSKTQRSGLSTRSGAREVHTCGVMQFWLASQSSERVSRDERIVHRAVLLRHLDALEPGGKPFETSF